MELTDKARKAIEEDFKLRDRSIEILELVVAEWKSDPKSVQCFDLRIVQEAIKITERRKQLEESGLTFRTR
jgi:hypothetical protein